MAAMGLAGVCVAFNFVLRFIIPLVAHLNYIYYAGTKRLPACFLVFANCIVVSRALAAMTVN